MKIQWLIGAALLLAIAGAGLSAEKTKSEKIKQLLEIRMTRKIVPHGKMTPLEKEYYESIKSNENYSRKVLKQPPIATLELEHITVSQGKCSPDGNYIANWKFVSLGTIIDGMEQQWRSDDGCFMLHADIFLMDKNLKTLWKKRLVWPKGIQGTMLIRQVCNNGTILLEIPPLSDTLPEGSFGAISSILEIIDINGKTIFSRAYGYFEEEKYSHFLTNNGRYLKIASYYWKDNGNGLTYISRFYDLINGDSIVIEGKRSATIREDGSIEEIGEGDSKWYYFPLDTLGRPRK